MLQIVNYSEKAIAVIGDTREAKDELKNAGGRFNSRLSCGAGWIFSKKALDAVNAIVAGHGGEKAGSEPEGAKTAPEGAAVYVGTYRKYNEGSLGGAWLKLTDYKDRDEFLAACYELHKDEKDPELMFQDWEHVPSWMIGESHIDAEVWGYREPEAKGTQSKNERLAILRKYMSEDTAKSWADDFAALVEAGGRCVGIKKPTIETEFCHPDEPEDEVRAWRKAVRTYEYFERQNLHGPGHKDLDEEIEKLEKGENLYLYDFGRGVFSWSDRAERYEAEEPMSEEMRLALIPAYKGVRESFVKRLKAWWKRYGPDKLHTWTYWENA